MSATESTSAPALQNKLLAAIPDSERERVLREITPMFLPLGQILYESGAQLSCVYFPTSAIVSLSHVMADGTSAEVALIGNEGIVGVALFMGDAATPSRAIVQSSGWAYGLRGPLLEREFSRGGAMLQLLLHYTQTLIAQMAQTAVCNQHHSVEQQLCRWLLLRLDRMGTEELAVTEEAVADMVGVRHDDVVAELGKLRSLSLLHYGHGQIKIVNRVALEARACGCYSVIKGQSDWLFNMATNPPAVPVLDEGEPQNIGRPRLAPK
jgi:CRP-like cAMP-binding protein